MKKLTLLLMVFMFFAGTSSAQNSKATKITYNLGYHGNMLYYPGLKAGIDYPWKQKIKKRRNGKTKTLQWNLIADAGFFRHGRRYSSAFTTLGVAYVKIGHKGFRKMIYLEPLSVMRTFLPETYKVKTNGDIEKVFLPGRFYYAPTIGVGIGKNTKGKRTKNWFLNLKVATLYKYNSSVLPMINIQYGYRLNKRNNSDEIQ